MHFHLTSENDFNAYLVVDLSMIRGDFASTEIYDGQLSVVGDLEGD